MSYRNAGRSTGALALLLGVAGIAAAQMIPPPPVLAPASELEELDEAKVKATRLWQMRENIVAAEERFYALYNELNQNDDYDVHCRNEAPLGTRLKKRTCRIAYHEEAQAEEAQAFLRGESVQPADLVLLARYSDYQKAALAVINGDPRLRRLIREREDLQKRYEAERKKRFKGKWILFE